MAGHVELLLLRHAHAGDPASWQGPDDVRPLSGRGRRQAEQMGRLLAEGGVAPSIFLTSPLARARETAEIVAGIVGAPVRLEPRLVGGLDLGVVEEILRDAGDPPRPVLVGHDPDFSELLVTLVGADTLRMRKGALARLDGVRPLQPGGAELRWLVPPDLLGR